MQIHPAARSAHPRHPGRLALAIALALPLAALMSGCGGGGSSGSGGGVLQQQGQHQNMQINAPAPGTAIVKLRSTAAGWMALAETLQRIDNVARPERRLLVSHTGARADSSWLAPAGWSLVDFTVHPSGQASLVLATDSAIRLVRLNAQGQSLSSHDFADPLAPNDPFLGELFQIRDRHALVPRNSRDAARIGAVGEDAVLVLRTGLNAVVAYRLGYGTAAGFQQQWRTLVEPGVTIGNVGLTSGTIDPFGGLDNQWRLVMDVDPAGRVAVGVNSQRTELAEGHAAHFQEPYYDQVYGVFLVTQLAANGQRVGTVAIEPGKKAEVHAIRWTGDAVAVGGRIMSESKPDGSGWNAWVNVVRPANGGLQQIATLDYERGDVVLDIAPAADGQLLVAGSTS